MMAWGLANLWKDGQEGGYLIRHGCTPVNDFGGSNSVAEDANTDLDWPNLFEKAFPCLFPY
jgi:hypothetical protein